MRKIFVVLMLISTGFAIPRWVDWIEDYRAFPRSPAEMERTIPLETVWTGFDILRYDATLDFAIPSRAITAAVNILVKLLDPLDTLYIDFSHLLSVDSLYLNASPIEIIRTGDSICVPLLGNYSANDTVIVRVVYRGSPWRGYYARQNPYGQNVFFTFTEPSDAPFWFPCHNVPYDKAYFTLTASVPLNYIVAGNGLITVDSVDIASGKRYVRWEESFPMAIYLFSVAIYPYWFYAETTSTGVPVYYYMYPEDSLKFSFDWSETPNMIESFERIYGEYPFEKYGMAECPIMGGWGAMEHQTCTSFGDRLVDGSGRFKDVVAHELSHMWWGDMVTCGTWKDIWLNEGFATYSEALYVEMRYGFNAFRDYIASMKAQYFAREASEGRFPIYDPDYMWGVTVYNKGGVVLDMLRKEVGDSVFFAILREYRRRYEYSYALTSDFIEVCNDVAGRSLDWFFDEWVYSPGYPELDYWWNVASSDTGWLLNIQFRQVQVDAPIFRFPLEIRVTSADSVRTFVVLIENESEHFTFHFPRYARPVVVELDPDSYVLMKYTYRGTLVSETNSINPFAFSIETYPNPFNSSVAVRLSLPFAAEYTIYVIDMLGRKIDELAHEYLAGGQKTFTWSPPFDLPSGTYFLIAESPFGICRKAITYIK